MKGYRNKIENGIVQVRTVQVISLLAVSSLLIVCFCSSCKKGWLDAKPNQSLVILDKIKNIQGILDNDGEAFWTTYPIIGEAGSDDYYLTTPDFLAGDAQSKNIYTWAAAPDFYGSSSVADWDYGYKQLFYANTAITEINKITPGQSEYNDWANVKGSALFYRAYSIYNLAQVFCKPYIPATANSDLGIILRLDPDINLPSVRATVLQTYDQVISDLEASVPFLPVTPLFRSRPSKAAAYAMLARVYLSMQNYDKAFTNADLCLQGFNTLIDYNTLDSTLTFPFPPYPNNPEMILRLSNLGSATLPFTGKKGIVDSVLFGKYSSDDLRRNIFFKQSPNGKLQFRGTYLGTSINPTFGGIATDEIYLTRAECNARKGNLTDAMIDLNKLLIKRWRAGTFTPVTATNADDALRKILDERRKELCFRTIRWTDLRRLNQDDRFKIILTRIVNGQTYTLPPNDNRYVYPIPNNEIVISGVAQNPR